MWSIFLAIFSKFILQDTNQAKKLTSKLELRNTTLIKRVGNKCSMYVAQVAYSQMTFLATNNVSNKYKVYMSFEDNV